MINLGAVGVITGTIAMVLKLILIFTLLLFGWVIYAALFFEIYFPLASLI